MGIETIIGLAALIISAIAGAFGLGHIRGASKAEAKADQQRNEDNAAAMVAAAERRVEKTKEASNVQQTVNRMPDDDVDSELRGNWTRKG
ncbi:DUF5316 domain-containing protein [Enterobacter hormaechei]|uniref:hypothetical protein n=1 Tax=Enterobacter hormaechei TaxID=158836 RepID=UPI00141B009F|nr:hypothetical protein [Enterobacter hormaechei]MCM8066385.1 DUF5316 domain-containing protein [Enterobacter hormaechei]MCM8122934.1 DUF5316 domain-containing protein [Enterobacter hormaechei]